MQRTVPVTAMVALALMFSGKAAAQAAETPEDCRVGLYRLSDGSLVDIGHSEETTLRWRRKDGATGQLKKGTDGTWTSTTGWTGRADGITVSFDCGAGGITFGGKAGRRVAFAVTETRFRSGGVELAGRLLMPQGEGTAPLVVLIHGSERFSGRRFYALQRLFPSDGIGVFVYDKRGTGASGGDYTHDYEVLARDAAAALGEARRLAGRRAGRAGFHGGSQGGWVAPLAATMAPVDFVIVAYGLAVSPLDEDREAIVLDMTRHGYGPDVVARAMEVADATAAILLSNFADGYERLDALRAKYGKEPWFRHVRGNATQFILEMSEAELREKGPTFFPGIPLQYDPMPVLRRLDVPQLWILGGEDLAAPSAETLRRLQGLAAAGRPILTALFPTADHGIYEFETAADGERLVTRNSEGYYAMMRDYIARGRLHPPYGDSRIMQPGQ